MKMTTLSDGRHAAPALHGLRSNPLHSPRSGQRQRARDTVAIFSNSGYGFAAGTLDFLRTANFSSGSAPVVHRCDGERRSGCCPIAMLDNVPARGTGATVASCAARRHTPRRAAVRTMPAKLPLAATTRCPRIGLYSRRD